MERLYVSKLSGYMVEGGGGGGAQKRRQSGSVDQSPSQSPRYHSIISSYAGRYVGQG